MRVLITGGTGFVGPAIVRSLLAEGHEVTLLIHKTRGPFTEEAPPGLAFAQGDVTRPEGLRAAAQGHDAVVHLVALRRGSPGDFERAHVDATRNVLAAAKAAGARRFLHMSAHGVKPDGTPYQRTKSRAEALVKESGHAWTIFQPTFITGPPEGKAEGFDQEFARIARSAPALPNFAGGRFLLQPVAKRDVALAFARALAQPASEGKTYVLAGPEALTWEQYLRRLCDVVGVRRPLLPAPAWLLLPVAGLLGGFAWFPASRDELAMLFEGHAGDATEAARDLGLTWTDHRAALEEALAAPGGSRTPPSGAARPA